MKIITIIKDAIKKKTTTLNSYIHCLQLSKKSSFGWGVEDTDCTSVEG